MEQNYGDDLMLARLVQEMEENCEIYIYCPPNRIQFYRYFFRNCENVHFAQYPLSRIYKYEKNFFDYVIFIGGSIFQGGIEHSVKSRIKCIIAIMIAKMLGAKFLVLGCNVGPFATKFKKILIQINLRQACFLTTRDSYSYDFICKTRRKTKNVFLYPDILSSISRHLGIQKQSNDEVLGISVYGYSLTGESLLAPLTDFCDLYVEKTGGRVVLLCFCTGAEGDDIAAEELFQRVKKKENFSIIRHAPNRKDIIEAMATCSRLLAIRFHAAILSVSLGIPFLSICYSNKMQEYLKDIGHSERANTVKHFINVDKKFFLEELLNHPIIPSDSWTYGADSHFKILRDFMKGECND